MFQTTQTGSRAPCNNGLYKANTVKKTRNTQNKTQRTLKMKCFVSFIYKIDFSQPILTMVPSNVFHWRIKLFELQSKYLVKSLKFPHFSND